MDIYEVAKNKDWSPEQALEVLMNFIATKTLTSELEAFVDNYDPITPEMRQVYTNILIDNAKGIVVDLPRAIASSDMNSPDQYFAELAEVIVDIDVQCEQGARSMFSYYNMGEERWALFIKEVLGDDWYAFALLYNKNCY